MSRRVARLRCVGSGQLAGDDRVGPLLSLGLWCQACQAVCVFA